MNNKYKYALYFFCCRHSSKCYHIYLVGACMERNVRCAQSSSLAYSSPILRRPNYVVSFLLPAKHQSIYLFIFFYSIFSFCFHLAIYPSIHPSLVFQSPGAISSAVDFQLRSLFVLCCACLRSGALNQIHIDSSHVYEFIVLPTQTNQSETIYESARFVRSSCIPFLRWHRRSLVGGKSGEKNENIILLQCLRM